MNRLIYKLPREFIERMKIIYPHLYLKILNSFLSDKIPTFRSNLIKIDSDSLVKKLNNQNIRFKRVSWYRNAFILIESRQRDFQNKDIYKQGLVYLQNLSSMLPVIFLKPERNEKILDLCAAPGGKTGQIVSEAEGEAEVMAVEKIKVRFYKLLANLKKQSISKFVKTKLDDGANIWRKCSEYFDKVLVDAPCSSEANFLIHNPRTYSYWSYRKIKEAQHRQKRLLFSGIMSLKRGGLLVYSTCTFSPEENEEVINWALEKFKDKIYLENIKLSFNNFKDGLLEWKTRFFSKTLRLTKRIIPTDTMEGFFIALLRKK